MANPTYLIDDSVVAIRGPEVPNASFVNGANVAGSNAPGIGINLNGGAVVGEDQQFTLLDQRGNARAPQTSQYIGGEPLGAGQSGILPEDSIRGGTLPTQAAKDADPSLDGTIIGVGNATLADLATGWVEA